MAALVPLILLLLRVGLGARDVRLLLRHAAHLVRVRVRVTVTVKLG
jgi:hypothetical protein